MDFLPYFIARTIRMILAVVNIGFAICSYKEEKYFSFGFWIMFAYSNSILIAKMILKG